MKIKSSTALRNEYVAISKLAHETAEPIYITKNGEGDLVLMSITAFEEREKMYILRAKLLEAELSRLNGERTYQIDEVRTVLKEKYHNGDLSD
jgi:PHD/YefM family antitoxin component YafN of YafNO toxin-antitoxin module